MKNLAPIGLSTYSRVGHLQKTVEALQANDLAKDSELHIFSDAPKAGDEDKVQAVRDYLKTIDGFKEVHIYEREENNRVANNRGGMRMLLESHGRMIFVEEDSVTAPSFLRFMNQALDAYEHHDKVFGICGYMPPIDIPRSYTDDVVLLPRFFCYAFALWKKSFDAIEMNITQDDFDSIYLNRQLRKKYCEGGSNAIPQLSAVVKGRVDALDIRIDYTMFRKKMYALHPTHSLVTNIGMDGSGENWVSKTTKFDVHLSEVEMFNLTDDLHVNRCLLAEERKFLSIRRMEFRRFPLLSVALLMRLKWGLLGVRSFLKKVAIGRQINI